MKNLKNVSCLLLLCLALACPAWAGEPQESFETLISTAKTAKQFSEVAALQSAEVTKFAKESKSNEKFALKSLQMLGKSNLKFKSEKVSGKTAKLNYVNDQGPLVIKMAQEGGKWKYDGIAK